MSTPESVIECPNCGKEYDPAVFPLYCPRCGESNELHIEGDFSTGYDDEEDW
jgi:Zn finger protein HypA/HybF involved in hydrogenase expression